MDAWEPWAVPSVPRPGDLAHGEAVILTQTGVGLYDGDNKVPTRSHGTAVLTTHRLAYIDARDALAQSAYVPLSSIRETEHYAGFLTSSAKIVLRCAREERTPWTCHVCGTFHAAAALDGRCRVCGVKESTDKTRERACPRCTLLNPLELERCQLCEAPMVQAPRYLVSKLSFRQGGDKAWYAELRATLQRKPWAQVSDRSAPGLLAVDRPSSPRGALSVTAFDDLEALMRRAKDMVRITESLRAEVERRERAVAPGAAPPSEVRSLLQRTLVQLGLPSPAVTPDMARDERAYHRELACELASVLVGEHGLLAAGRVVRDGAPSSTAERSSSPRAGVLPLDEVWGLWNRARGVALVSPSLMRAVAVYLPEVTEPRIELRTLRSGLVVLHTPHYEAGAVQARVLHYLADAESSNVQAPGLAAPGLGTSAIAAKERLPVPLVRDLLETVEYERGAIVRDECGTHDTLWFRNCILARE